MGNCTSNYSLIEKTEYCRVCGDLSNEGQWFCEDCCKKSAGIRITSITRGRGICYAPFYVPDFGNKYVYSCRVPDILKNHDEQILFEFGRKIDQIVTDWNKIKTPYDIPNLEQIAYNIIMKHLETVNVIGR